MNILFLSELLYPHGGGAELATYLWAKLLAKSGQNVKVVTNRYRLEPERSKETNLEIFRLPILQARASTKYPLLARFDVLLSTFTRKALSWADVVYVPRHWYSSIPVAKAYGKTVITHLHDYIPICSLATLYDLSRNRVCDLRSLCHPSCLVAHEAAFGRDSLEVLGSSLLNLTIWRHVGRLIELSDAVVCVSRAQRNLIVRGMSSLEKRCHVVHNPLPPVSQLDIKGDDLGYFGGPSPLKGFNLLNSALKLVNSMQRIHATGFDLSRPATLEPTGDSRIIFHERVPECDLHKIYEIVRTVIVPSVWAEPAPYVVAEAMLQGRLIIASEVGGIPELVGDSPGAFLFRAGDSRHLADLIDRVTALEKDTVLDLAAKNKELFLRRYSDEQALEDFMSVLEKTAA